MSSSTEPRVIRGAKYVYALQPGETWTVSGDWIVIAHPDRPPKGIDKDGFVVEIEPMWAKQ